jgi:hypothetical protein
MPMHPDALLMRPSAMPMHPDAFLVRPSAMPMHSDALLMRPSVMPMHSDALKTLRFIWKTVLSVSEHSLITSEALTLESLGTGYLKCG